VEPVVRPQVLKFRFLILVTKSVGQEYRKMVQQAFSLLAVNETRMRKGTN